MKHLKLFENFSDEIKENNKFANDLVEDIKTISYLLEDEGFELRYCITITKWNKFLDGNKTHTFEVGEYNDMVNAGHIKPVMVDMIVVKAICATITDPITFQKVLNKSYLDAVDRYVELLKEHLDYINPDNISTERSLMGNINIIIKL